MKSNMAPRKRNAKSKDEADVFSQELMEAIVRNDKEGVEEQITRGASLKAYNSQGQTPLQVAIENGNINIVEIIVENGADVNQDMLFGKPFYYAASLGFTGIVKYLMDKGVNVNGRNRNGDTAMHAICRNLSDRETCTFLLKLGADPNLENDRKQTPLDCAYQTLNSTGDCISKLLEDYKKEFEISLQSSFENINLVADFLDYGVDLGNIIPKCPQIFVNAVNAENVKLVKYLVTRVDSSYMNEKNLLKLAIDRNNLEIIQILVDNGADLHRETSLGVPFHLAVNSATCDIVNYFLQKGTDVNRKNQSGNTPLHIICMTKPSENSIKVCRMLLSHGAALEELNIDDNTPLQLAIGERNEDIAKVLLDAGADVWHETERGKPFHLAASNGCLDTTKYLLNNGVHVDVKNKMGHTALHEICISPSSSRHLEICRLLLECGANIIALDNENETPVFYALQSLNNLLNTVHKSQNWNSRKTDSYKELFAKLLPVLDIIHDFLNLGINLDDVLERCPNILHAAVAAGHDQSVKYLLQRNVNVNGRMEEDATPLHCAAFFGRLEVMAALIRHGADIDATMSKKLTPLHLATIQGHVSFAIALMNFGADIDAQDDWGRTALHNASWFRNAAIMWALLLREADTGIKDMNDETAYESLISEDVLENGLRMDKEYIETLFTEATAIVSNAFFGFRFCPIHFLYKIKKNFKFNQDLQLFVDDKRACSKYLLGLALRKNKKQMLEKNQQELMQIVEAKTTECVFAQEIILMRDTVICNNFTLYDLLTEDCKKLARYLVDVEISDLSAFSRNGFYYPLQKRLNAVQQFNLFRCAAYELGQRLQIRLPIKVMDKIVNYLKELDVRNILRATIGYESKDNEKIIQEAEQEVEATFLVGSQTRYPRSFDDDPLDGCLSFRAG